MGLNLNDPHYKETPMRVARFFLEFFNVDMPNIKVFPNPGYNQMIFSGAIPFFSLCAHHLVPFFGYAYVAYIPRSDGNIIGLSKIARVVDYFARKEPTVQEILTQRIADYLYDKLKPHGVGVLIKAKHLCVEMRGIKKAQVMITSALRGNFHEHDVKQEFLELIKMTNKNL